jgi:hypothetical protein
MTSDVWVCTFVRVVEVNTRPLFTNVQSCITDSEYHEFALHQVVSPPAKSI